MVVCAITSRAAGEGCAPAVRQLLFPLVHERLRREA